jgi:hypothetical protein
VARAARRGLTRRPSVLAVAYGKVGRIAEGLAAAAEVLDYMRNQGERLFEAELYRVRGVPNPAFLRRASVRLLTSKASGASTQ